MNYQNLFHVQQSAEHNFKYGLCQLVLLNQEAVYAVGFPALQVVQTIVDSVQEVYQQKTKPCINIFKLYPKGMKGTSRLSGSLNENLAIIAGQYEYEQDYEGSTATKKKMGKTVYDIIFSGSQNTQSNALKKHPLYRLYSPANPVLKEEYTILSMEEHRKITNKQEEECAKDRIKQWIQVGYHIHVAQAYKMQQSQGRLLIYMQKLKGKNLRDLISQGFFSDKNKYLNSKRLMNCWLQIAVGLNYIHKRGIIHQNLIPDHIYVQNDRILKVGNIVHANLAVGKITKNSMTGGSPEYFSIQQGYLFDSIKERAKEGAYPTAMKLLPALTGKSDIYQLGLLAAEMMVSKRIWRRGDKISLNQLKAVQSQFNINKQTSAFLLQKLSQILLVKPQQRKSLRDLIPQILQFYAKTFKNAQDLLWCRFFDQQKYESDLLNNKAVGLYLSGNETECEKAWMRSVNSNPQNLSAVFNYGHYRRMKRIIDDRRLNKQLQLQPQSRKRNYYQLITNLVLLPLLKQPFKTFNFNPKLSRQKQIQVISNIIDALDKCKKPKDYCFMKKQHLYPLKFDQSYICDQYFLGRIKNKNTFYAFKLDQDIRTHTFLQIKSLKQPSTQNRLALSCIDPVHQYLAMSDNSYLCVFNIRKMTTPEIHLQIVDYGSGITTMCFDQKSQVLGIGSSQFTIKLINLVSKGIHKVINIGQKFIIKNLNYYDRNTCIGYSYQKALTFHRIQTGKQLFMLRTSAIIVNYSILQVNLSNHLLIAHTAEKFQIWNLKDKVLIRNIQIDEAPKIQGFFTHATKKLVVHFTKHAIRLWNYSNGLILKTFRSPIPYVWIHLDQEATTLRSLDSQGNLLSRNIDFNDFIKYFQGICVPNEICLTDDRQDYGQEITQYVNLGRQLIQNLNEYRLNEQQKKVALQKMYRLGQTIKNSLFFQDKQDIKTVFLYLNAVRQAQDRSSRINAHAQQYVFTSRKQQFITATSNVVEGYWLIGQSDGTIRLLTSPDQTVMTIKPKTMPVAFLQLQPTSIFIGYQASCLLLERQTLNIVVQHSAYHKKPVRMGLVLNSVLVTGDEDELILFWNKQRVRRYQIPVNIGEIVGKKLLVGGFDNRIRIYDLHSQQGLIKLHVFIGHVMNLYNIVAIDDGIFTSYSYDGTIRWWNTQVKSCFSFFNFKKYFRGDKILWVDLPKFSLQQQKHARFDRQGCALILLNSSQIVVFDTMRKEIKWRLQLPEQVVKVFWTNYPNTFAAVTYEQCTIYSIYWRYMMLKK